MFAKTLAAIVLLICIVLALRMVLPDRHVWRMDAQGRKAWAALRGMGMKLRNWRRDRDLQKNAAAEAEAAIKRARTGSKMVDGEWDGNVYRPKSFDNKKDKRNLH